MKNQMKTHPKHVLKHCNKCGSSDTFYTDGDAVKCRACGFQLYINAAPAVAGLIINDNDELLLTVRKYEPFQGMLDLPGGFVDHLETAEEALTREIKEELNLNVKNLKYFCSTPNRYLYGGLTYFTLDFSFQCEVENFEGMHACDDVKKIYFIHIKDIDPKMIGGQSMSKAVKKFQQYWLQSKQL
ncbi:MAG: NUDIX domain-containing protein [Cytophagales bacterium]|nr:NUDIX domain-containing protein [Cytophagales bacterium]